MNYKGSCHCGNISFEVRGLLTEVIQCNCSICSKRGALMWFVSKADFHLITPKDNYTTYTFNTHTINHRICPSCGCAPFEESVDKEGLATVAINARCIDNLDLASLNIIQYDGKQR